MKSSATSMKIVVFWKGNNMRNELNIELMLDDLENKGMLDQMLTDKIIHDYSLFGSYEWKWCRWVRVK